MELVLVKTKLKQLPVGFMVLLLAVVLVVLFFTGHTPNKGSVYPESLRKILYPSPIPLVEFELKDHNQNAFGLPELTNTWTFVFFGYTQCPDICPATLLQMVELKKQITEANVNSTAIPQFIFVSVDPQRDGITELAEYISYFDNNFIAVTGELENITKLERQLSISHRYEKKNSQGEYAVTHSAEIFLIGPMATVLAKFRPPLNTADLAKQFSDVVDYFSKNKQNNT